MPCLHLRISSRLAGIVFVGTALSVLTACTNQRPVAIASHRPRPIVTRPQPRLRPAPALEARAVDARVAAILLEANNAEITEARLALRMTRSPSVRQFARRMVSDHSRLEGRLSRLVAHLEISPIGSPSIRHLTRNEQETLDRLARLRGRAFDRAYIHHQVAIHQAVLTSIDRSLLPDAQHPQLRTALMRTRSVIVMHLRHAEALQAAFR